MITLPFMIDILMEGSINYSIFLFGFLMGVLGYLMGVLGYLMVVIGYPMGVLGYLMA